MSVKWKTVALKNLDFESALWYFSFLDGPWDFEHPVQCHINREAAVGTTGDCLVICRASACLKSIWKILVLCSLTSGIQAEKTFSVMLDFSAFLQ